MKQCKAKEQKSWGVKVSKNIMNLNKQLTLDFSICMNLENNILGLKIKGHKMCNKFQKNVHFNLM